MKLFFALLLAGPLIFVLGIAIVGLALTIDSDGVALVGGVVMLLGLLVFIGAFFESAFRPPTAKQLARQKASDYQTWHIRPLGLLILVVLLGGGGALALWAETALSGPVSRRRPWSIYVVGLLFGVLLLFKRVRDLIFYAPPGDADKTPAKQPDHPPAETDRPRD
jgi:hypothetical protein